MSDNEIQLLHKEYRDSLENWRETPSSVQDHYAKLIANSWQRAKYVVRNLPFAEDKLVVCPPASILNMAPNQQHRGDYGSGVFEGSSAEPVVDKNNKIVGINVILHEPRMARFMRSMKARNFSLAMPFAKFAQSALDIVAIHGTDIVTADDGSPTRAYIRPSAGPGVCPWGVSIRKGSFIEASNIVFRWGYYFSRGAIVEQAGAKVAITGLKRTFKITGKHASNYGAAAIDGAVVRSLKYDELIYLAPYCIKNNQLDYGINDFDELRKYGVLSDGPGEELIGVLKDEATIVYPPLRVNRLGGTVLDYVVKYLAPALGLQVREQDITLEQIRSGEIVGLAYAGNAVKITPVTHIDIVKPKDDGGEVVETLIAGGVHPVVAKIREKFLAEVSGKVKPSHESLLTPVDLKWGAEFRAYLDEFWG